jgi:hypothetical protein
MVLLLSAFGQGIRIFVPWQLLQSITGDFKVSGVRFQVSGKEGFSCQGNEGMEHRAWRMGLKIHYANSVIILRRFALCSLPCARNQQPETS